MAWKQVTADEWADYLVDLAEMGIRTHGTEPNPQTLLHVESSGKIPRAKVDYSATPKKYYIWPRKED